MCVCAFMCVGRVKVNSRAPLCESEIKRGDGASGGGPSGPIKIQSKLNARQYADWPQCFWHTDLMLENNIIVAIIMVE